MEKAIDTKPFPQMDWQQVVLNGGPPCFATLDDEDGWFCGRAQRWEGHDYEHKFVSLNDYMQGVQAEERERAAKIAETASNIAPHSPLRYAIAAAIRDGV